jgi:puromycin-sensitive aminopeptidase
MLMVFSFSSLPQFTSFEKAREIEEFFSSRAKPSMARNLKQSIEQVYINANWVLSVQKEEHLANTVKELAQRKY